MWPFTKKINRVDVMGVLNLYRNSRSNFEFGIDPSDGKTKVPIAFKADTCNEAINAINRALHPVDDYFKTINYPDKGEVAISPAQEASMKSAMAVAAASKNSNGKTLADLMTILKEEVEAANKVVINDMPRNQFGAENYRDLLFNHKSDIEKQLKAQHEQELLALEKLVKDPNFHEPGLPDKTRDAIAVQMKEVLAGKQKDELEKFNKELNEELNRLMNIQTADISRLAFLGLLAKSSKNAEVFKNLKKSLPSASGTGYSTLSNQTMLFGVELKDIKTFEAASEKSVTHDGNGVFTVQSKRLDRRLTKADFLACALGVKAVLDARGIPPENQTIIITINHTDPAMEKRLKKKAFEAALEAGFQLKNININYYSDKNEKMSPENVARELSINTSLAGMTSTYHDEQGNREFKEAVKSLRESKKTPTSGTTVSSTPPPGTTVSSTASTGTTISGTHRGTSISGSS